MTAKLNGATKLAGVRVKGEYIEKVLYVLSDRRIVYREWSYGSEGKEYFATGRTIKSLELVREWVRSLVEKGGIEVSVEAKKPDRGPSGIDFRSVFEQAHRAGLRAALECVPTPMVIQLRADPLNANSPIVHEYEPVNDGVCGFAWVNIHPGNSPAALYAKQHFGARAAYEGGMQIWISGFGQSMTKKYEYAQAFARVLQSCGIKAYPGSRMD